MLDGLTVTAPVAEGFAPALAVHTNGPELPITDRFVDCPAHIIVLAGVILIDGVVAIETVATADAVHVLTPEITVYVVVTVGLITIVPAAGGVEPSLADHVNGPDPDAVNVAF